MTPKSKPRAKRTPLYVSIREYVAERIRSGYWKRGDRLPSENELAEQFGVSRITAKLAMSALAEEGLIYRVQGRGSFVGDELRQGPAAVRPTSAEPAVPWAGFLVPSLDTSYTVNLLKGIEGALAEAGVRLVLCRTHESPDLERTFLEQLQASGAAGLIVYPAEGEAYNEDILRLTMDRYPIVVIDRYLKGLETNCVCSDHFEGARAATLHLLEGGHRKIAFLSPPLSGTSSLEERLEGYRQAFAESVLPLDNRLIVADRREEDLHSFFLNNADITAVFAANAGIGLRVMDALEEAGRRVPDDVSVVIFDTYEHAAYFRTPPTCVVQQEEEIGRQAARLLLSIIQDPSAERRKIVLPPRLVIGRSTAPAKLQT